MIKPSVARWHSINAKTYTIAILKIGESNKIKAFPFTVNNLHTHANEFEILLQNNLKMVYVDSFKHSEFEIIKFEVFLKENAQ